MSARRSASADQPAEPVSLPTMLIVHHDLPTLHYLDIVLRDIACRVWLHPSEWRFLQTLDASRPVVVLLDLDLRNGGSRSILEMLEIHPRGCTLPLLLSTTDRTRVPAVAALLDQHRHVILDEPLAGEQVLAAIEGLLGPMTPAVSVSAG